MHLLEPYEDAYKSINPVHVPAPKPHLLVGRDASSVRLLVLDIDETMIHTVDDKDPPQMKGAHSLTIPPVQMWEKGKLKEVAGPLEIKVNVRPHLTECLQELK